MLTGSQCPPATGSAAFVADAPHELQSPLTAFRTQLEVALAHPDPARLGRAGHRPARRQRGASNGSSGTCCSSPVDAGRARPRRRACRSRRRGAGRGDPVRLRPGPGCAIDTTAVSAAPVSGSRDELTRLVRNLLENAERHATSRVDVALRDGGTAVELVVRDDGPGIPPEQRRRVFDRFVRLDDARSREAGGSGLGLAIVASVVRRHGGTVDVGDGPGGATFVVRLPAPVSGS